MTEADNLGVGLRGSPMSQAGFLSPTNANGHKRSTSATSTFDYASSTTSPAMMNNEMPMGGGFNHPFVPQDLWQMPMTLDWDWAGMTDFSAGFDEQATMGTSNLPSSTSGFYQQNQPGANGATSRD